MKLFLQALHSSQVFHSVAYNFAAGCRADEELGVAVGICGRRLEGRSLEGNAAVDFVLQFSSGSAAVEASVTSFSVGSPRSIVTSP
eukprot:s11_g36.t1